MCLFGEHSDWAAEYRKADTSTGLGYTISCGLDQGFSARVYLRGHDFVFHSSSIKGNRKTFRSKMDLSHLLETAKSGGFWSYVAGAVYQTALRFPVGGLEIDNYTTGLPMKKGLGSSAAVSVLTVRAFNQAYGLGLGLRGEMETAYLGEVTTPSRCGRMDQGCAFGRVPILITYNGEKIEVEELSVGGKLYFVIADVGGNKDTVYILKTLREAFVNSPAGAGKNMREYLGPLNKRTVFDAVDFIEKGDPEGLGDLMTRTQRRFDECIAPACPAELTSPLLHTILGHPAVKPHVFGGKGVGSQGDGSAQFVCRNEDSQKKLLSVLQEDLGLDARGLVLFPTA
jgi:galactokinase